MRFGPMIAAASLATMLGAGAARAAPAVLRSAVDVGPAPQVELVRGGCGFGAHLTYHGTCHLNFGYRGRIRARHAFHRHHRFY